MKVTCNRFKVGSELAKRRNERVRSEAHGRSHDDDTSGDEEDILYDTLYVRIEVSLDQVVLNVEEESLRKG